MRYLDAIWSALVLSCLAGLLLYQGKAGAGAQPPSRWPKELPLGSHGSLLMLIHPHCPCSRASLAQLSAALRGRDHAPSTYVILVPPAEISTSWEPTDLGRVARAIPGVVTIDDRDGRLGRRFGAATSGQVLYYDSRGWLKFHGGLTPNRGHEGDSRGLRELVRALEPGDVGLASPAPVYGCPLFSKEDEICGR